MSSELRDLVFRDLEQIPLPPVVAWTERRSRRRQPRIGLLASAAIVVLVVVASLGGGQLLRVARDGLERWRAASTSGLVPGNDLIYVAYAATDDLASQGLSVVAMPGGQVFGCCDAATYVGTRFEGALMTITGDVAYLPVARRIAAGSDQYESFLQPIDLRRGAPLDRVSIGMFTVPQTPDLAGTTPFRAATATSADGRYVWLVRDTGERGQVAQIDRFDVHPFPGADPAAHTVLTTSGGTAVRSHVIPLGADKVIVVRERYSGLNRVAADWYVLDTQLNVIKSFEGDDTKRLPDSGLCSSDVRPDLSGSGWIVLCSDPSGAADGALLFLDGQRFQITGRVTLERSMGYAVAMGATGNGQIAVLTSRPVVARIDAQMHELIDARTVTRGRAWFEPLPPSVAAAKETGSSALISPDGRYAYLADSPDHFGALVTIDLVEATVIASTNELGTVAALGLSAGGDRLYALMASGNRADVRSVVLLEPRTLAIAARSGALPGAFAIAAVDQDGR
ncbi:MAG: hypothetical protein ABR537_13870 [Gemmatimonadales bacterium]